MKWHRPSQRNSEKFQPLNKDAPVARAVQAVGSIVAKTSSSEDCIINTSGFGFR
jgi:hypothetical protein